MKAKGAYSDIYVRPCLLSYQSQSIFLASFFRNLFPSIMI
jgi:hypothetical protein